MADVIVADYRKIIKSGLVSEFVIPIKNKCKDQAIKILEYLREQESERNTMIMKKNIKELFQGEPSAAIERYIDALEFTGAISSREFATSLIYSITPLGYAFLEVLREE